MIVKNCKKLLAMFLVIFIIAPYFPSYAIGDITQNSGETTVNDQNIVEGNGTVDTSKDNEVSTEDKEEIKDTEVVDPNTNNKEELEDGNKQDVITDDNKSDNETIKEDAVINEANKSNIHEGQVYEVISNAVAPFSRSNSNLLLQNSEREEFRLKSEGINTLNVLKPKTDSAYEVALAHSDGSYTFVKEASSLEEAVNITKEMAMPRTGEWVLPAVINSNGQVVYSTNAMGRIWKHIDGKPYPYVDRNTNLYLDEGLTRSITYVNHGYVEDVPVLADNGNAAKILVSGTEAWINKNTSASEFDMVVVPLNQVANPSYYIVEGGELKHFISKDLTGSGGHTIIIGKAPEYLSSGVKYFSYDGMYFYDGSNIQNGLNTLINDYKASSRSASVNSGNPHYTYYQNLPFRSKTVYTAEELNKYISYTTEEHSKLRNIGWALKDAEQKYGVNALLTLSVAMNESAKGTSTIALTKNNLFGINAVDSNPGQAANEFATPQDSVYEFTKNYISRGYADPADWRYFGGFLGNKKLGANVKYASDPYWAEKAARYAHDADCYLSGGINQLRDTNIYQLAVATKNTKVINSNGTLLYNVCSDQNQYSGYVNVPMVISKKGTVNVAGISSYEIYPERNTPVGSGGAANKYHGNYDWFDKGYISADSIKLINKAKDLVPKQPDLVVKGGNDRYSTAVELSKTQFTTSETVVLVNGVASADGLTATPIATFYSAPLLLTEARALPNSTIEELRRLGAKRVIIVGGEAVVSTNVVNQLNSLGISNITRLGGNDRYDTSLMVAKFIDANCYDVEKIVVTNGLGEADALSIAPIAGKERMPIILVQTNGIHGYIYNWLQSEALSNAYIIGGTAVLSDTVLNLINNITAQNIAGNRLGGSDRYETNARIIERFYGSTLNNVFVSKGVELVDALTAGPIAALQGAPIVLTGADLTLPQRNVLATRTANTLVQAGMGVSPTAINTLKKCLEKLEY